jgi:hypothetical protein
MSWGTGILECWNIGFGAMRSTFFSMALIGNQNQEIIRFSYPIFHFSTIPLFHGLPNGKHNSAGVKSKSEPLGQDSLLHLIDSITEFIYQSTRIVKTMKTWNRSAGSVVLILFLP